MSLARKLGDVELVSIDSMCVYKGMDIGTGKPTPAERDEVPHHLVDLIDPSEEFSVARYKQLAEEAISGIEERGCCAVLVGGTPLYLRAVVDDLEIPGRWPEVAAQLEARLDEPGGVEALHSRLASIDPLAAARMEPGNKRRVVRALEVSLGSGRPFSSFGAGLKAHPDTGFQLVAIDVPLQELYRRISDRFHSQLDAGLLGEVRELARRELSKTARQALGYRELLAYVAGEMDLDEAVDAAISGIRRLARRQLAWFRRDPRVEWTASPGKALAACERVLEDWAKCRR